MDVPYLYAKPLQVHRLAFAFRTAAADARPAAKRKNRSATVGKSSYGRHSHLAGFFGLHDDVCAVIGEPHYNVYRYAASSRSRPSAHSILYAPDPGGENIAQAPFSDSAAVPFAAT